MCGLAGFSGFDNNNDLASQANLIQQHRGPDHQGVWHDDYIALAHQRLSIIDLTEMANQPFHKGNCVIVFNGEIYNYIELKRKLETERNVSFKSNSDTEVVIEMYLQYGPECLDHFIGMFAFAIYNKETSDLFIARDHFGIKPLFYTCIETSFAFGSELKTLVSAPGFNKKINPKALVSCLNYLWVSGNETMFEGCFKLPPAHYLTYSKVDGIRLVRYWQLNDNKQLQLKDNEENIVCDVENIIELSVKRHMVADVEVSSFLSGGLDSSLISVIAKKSNTNLTTYTIGTSNRDKQVEQMPDDERFAEAVAKEFSIKNNILKINPNIINDLPFIVKCLDEPIGDPAAILTYRICKEAKKQNIKVLLSGIGADEIYFGYRRQEATMLSNKFIKIPSLIRRIISKLVNKSPVRLFNHGFKLGRWAKRFITFANLPLEEAYMRSYSYYDADELRELLAPNYWPAIDLIRDEHRNLFNAKYNNDPLNQMCNTDISMFMVGLNLTYTDRASMAASVEVRVPFVDKEVIEHAMRIPGEYKFKKGESKYVLKKAAEKFLPKSIIYRKKASFGAPIRSWISTDLKPMVDDLLSKESIEKRGLLNFSFVKKTIDDDRCGLEDNAYRIYQLLTLELWFREYLDKNN